MEDKMGLEKEIIYREQNEGNHIADYFNKGGMWALYGVKKGTKEYSCLNVGISKGIGQELLYDIACLTMLSGWKPDPGDRVYINQYGESQNFEYNEGMQRETLYRKIFDIYENFVFVYVSDSNDKGEEKKYAWSSHALYWRDSHPFTTEKKDFYDKHKDNNLNEDYKKMDERIRKSLEEELAYDQRTPRI